MRELKGRMYLRLSNGVVEILDLESVEIETPVKSPKSDLDSEVSKRN